MSHAVQFLILDIYSCSQYMPTLYDISIADLLITTGMS
jgi:hypothetical protein